MSGTKLVLGSMALVIFAFFGALWLSDRIGPLGGMRNARFNARVRAAQGPAQIAALAAGLPVLGQVPDFTLAGIDGKPVRRSDLAGRVWVADFIFTRCAGPCPAMSTRMSQLTGQFKADRNIQMVTFTVDPDRDTPAALAEYAGLMKADTTRWWFLTGSKEAMWALSREGFKLGAGENAKGTPEFDKMPFFHSTRFVLVDQQARIRGYYDGVDPKALVKLLDDARVLAAAGPAASAAVPEASARP